MKFLVRALLVLSVFAGVGLMTTAQENKIETIEQLNAELPIWGTAWKPGEGTTNGYYRSFYVGFAMRSEFPERIHIRLSRGNNTRLSVILDQQTVSDYIFDLEERNAFYKAVTESGKINIHPKGGKFLPQVSHFAQIIESPVYGILPAVEAARAGQMTDIEIYEKSLATLKALNPGRVFDIRLDLAAEFNKWKERVRNQDTMGVKGEKENTILAIDSLVWGRVNLDSEPTPEMKSKLAAAIDAAKGTDDEAFQTAALALFKEVTGSKYQIKIVDNGQWIDAIQCPTPTTCTLNYPEFTTIYPTGSYKSKVSDGRGNKVANFATPGLWQFIKYGSGVDRIPNKPYYGWMPKMDYQSAGEEGANGFHNPAVRNPLGKGQREVLGLPQDFQTLWAVLRGPVSHGCSRLAAGHILEMRFVMPVSGDKMQEIHHFGHEPQDFDLFDINGDGNLEVMGVKYAVMYDFVDREGKGAQLGVTPEGMAAFHENLYGTNDVYTVSADGTLMFSNPRVSLPSYLDDHKFGVKVRPELTGSFPLWEQEYEKDKLQFYAQVSNSVVQMMGRVRGCAPSSKSEECGQSDFRATAESVIKFKNWRN